MAIAKFCKLDLVVHESVRDEVISDLQKLDVARSSRLNGQMGTCAA